jgi:hypothetical protein
MKIIVLFLLLFINIFNIKSDDSWDKILFHKLQPGLTYKVISGSGFYVNNNFIITNAHIIKNCKNIAIRGAVLPQLVSLIVKDERKDLALLYSQDSPKKIPYFCENYKKINYNDKLFIAGYPKDASKTGIMVIRDAVVKNIIYNHDFTRIDFTNVVEPGNSGGPIIDKNSNIIGIVTSQVTYELKDEFLSETKKMGQGVGLDGIIEFLSQNKISYFLKSTYDIFVTYNVKELKDYLVNIYCVYSE